MNFHTFEKAIQFALILSRRGTYDDMLTLLPVTLLINWKKNRQVDEALDARRIGGYRREKADQTFGAPEHPMALTYTECLSKPVATRASHPR